MSIVSYNGKKLSPAPFVSITKQYTKSGNGDKIGALFSISIKGTCVVFTGSPDKDGVFYTGSNYPPDARTDPTYVYSFDENEALGIMLRKAEAIRTLFSEEGKSLEIQSFNGSPPMKCNPRIISVNIPEGQWYNTFEYTVDMECDVMYINGTDITEDDFDDVYISALSEGWQIETLEEPENLSELRTYRVTHNLNATGKKFYDENGDSVPAWKQARKAVVKKLGFNRGTLDFLRLSGVQDLPSYFSQYNHVRSENINESEGSYDVNETWILASGTASENFTIETNSSRDSALTRVSIQGQIQGYEVRNSGLELVTSKYHNASGKYDEIFPLLYQRAKAFSNVKNLCPIMNTYSKTSNVFAGNIGYNCEFDNRPSGLITATKYEDISIGGNFGSDVFAVIPVLGRKRGPVLQNIGTKKECTRNLSVNVTFDRDLYLASAPSNYTILNVQHPRFTHPYSGDIQRLVNEAHPVLSLARNNLMEIATKAYVQDQSENWNPQTLNYTYNVSWTFE